ncbi:MAG: TlpA family protein disulfide reductase [Gammaproteobacteria bacterium]|nr:TlpA family protein disulfide reductase [Gammaproteobacteria bacterium]
MFLLYLTSSLLTANANEYKLTDLNGKPHSLQQYKGKWLIVNYWATSCSTCVKEIPNLTAFHENIKNQDVIVIGINSEAIELAELKEFVNKKKIPYKILQGETTPVTPVGRVPVLPTTYIIDPGGKTVAGNVGIVPKEYLEKYIAQRKKENAKMGLTIRENY